MKIDHNYLAQQFDKDATDTLIQHIRDVIARGDFTLGKEVGIFEREFATFLEVKHAIGVANGTDALYLALKALKVGNGEREVITSPYSFYATTASIVNAGGKPVYVDAWRDFNIDPNQIEDAITQKTVGIVLVHWAGRPCDMDRIMDIAKRNGLWVLEDSAHAVWSLYHGRKCGTIGNIGTFSLHPLKNVNVWGDGGVIVTDSDTKDDMLRKLRNHGMVDRNTATLWGYNSRLDTVQAVVASYVLGGVGFLTNRRRANAAYLNGRLSKVAGVELPLDAPNTEPNYYLYSFHAERRDELQAYLMGNGVDAKVHYPKPLHLQPAWNGLYQRGQFPIAEWCADSTLSLPVHEYLKQEDLETMATLVETFYGHA